MTVPSLDISGKRAMITGAAGGFGLVMAEAFAAAGARVEICDVDAGRIGAAIQDAPNIGGTVCDLSDADDTKRFFDTALERPGGVDILVNNVGITGPVALAEDISMEDWNKTFAINVSSYFQMTQLATPHLRRSGNGRVINIASTAGTGAFTYRSPYITSKWAVIGLTKALAKELGPSNICVNCISPGSVEGDRMDGLLKAWAQGTGNTDDTVRSLALEASSMNLMVRAKDIAGMALFLASPAAERMSGHNFIVDADSS